MTDLPPLTGLGTPESMWRAWRGPASWPELDTSGADASTRLVVVSPHPDDSVLGVGGLLAQLGAAGAEVVLVAVTDGGAAYDDWPELAGLRVTEDTEAFARLGLPDVQQVRLGLPDSAVRAADVHLEQVLRPGDWCLAPWALDGHPDHDATGAAAARAARAVGARLLAYPVWTWHWAAPDDARVPWARARRVTLTPEAAGAKRRAVAAHRSQIQPDGREPILPPWVLERLLREYEVVFG